MTARLLGGCASSSSSSRAGAAHAAKRRAGSARIAHLTDFHVQEPRGGDKGMAMCLRHAQSLKHKPDLILNTGDCVMDVLNHDRAHAQNLWDLWSRVLKAECSTPIEHCLGNHDHWGWVKERSGTSGNEPGWGKQWAMDVLGLAKPYHAFDCGAWRIVMLDSVQPAAEGVWESRLDDAQFAWLESELAATTAANKPVLVGSHVPILSPAVFLDRGRIGGTTTQPALAVRRCHLDVKKIGQLFVKHPNVKLCVSGHLHQIDRADYRGVSYLTNPAVCGGWWTGYRMDVFGAGYTMLDLHADGTFDIDYVDYGWTVQPAPASAPAAAALTLTPSPSGRGLG